MTEANRPSENDLTAFTAGNEVAAAKLEQRAREKAKNELQGQMQLMTSQEANFEAGTWTLRGPFFTVSGGDYLIISCREWNQFWSDRDV